MLLENSSLYNVLSRRHSRKTDSLINAKRKICCKPNSESAERAKYITTKVRFLKTRTNYCVPFAFILIKFSIWLYNKRINNAKPLKQTVERLARFAIKTLISASLLTFLDADTRLIIVFASHTWQHAKNISNSGTSFNKKRHLLGFTCRMITTQKQASFFI